MLVSTDQYIFPPRPSKAVPRSETGFYADYGWLAQLKFNDTRCVVKFADGGVELWNRHAERMRSYHAPDHLVEQLLALRDHLGLSRTEVSMLDGGLLDKKHRAIKDTIVIWDILVRDGEHLLDSTHGERYDQIARGDGRTWMYEKWAFGLTYSPDVFYPVFNKPELWDGLWSDIAEINAPFEGVCGPLIEGLMFKDLDGVLEMGMSEKNNSYWCARSRVVTGRHNF
jgi:hypothetical protein